MKISKETLEVLKNFSAINPNLVIQEGNTLTSIAEAKNIMTSCEVTETFEKSVGIYDLNEFLSALSLIENPTLEFGDDSVLIKSDKASVTYRYADKSILTAPERAVNMPSAEVEVDLCSSVISEIRKAGSALGHPVVSITTKSGSDKILLEVKDPNNSASNVYQLEVGSGYEVDADFDFQFLIANLKLIPGDYKVSVSSKLISHWACKNTISAEYWIALEKSSTYTSA
jgi:hypothetical protein